MQRKFAATLLTTAAALSVPLSTLPADAAGAVKLGAIQYDSPGSDGGSNSSVNAEWVTIKNTSSKGKTLTGWTLRDNTGHVYKFPTFTLKAGNSVRVHTGKGSKDGNDLYWGQDYYVWNNSGDKAILRNKSGDKVDACSWGDGDGTVSC